MAEPVLPPAPLYAPLVSPHTGQLQREWYVWFTLLNSRVGGSAPSLDELMLLQEFGQIPPSEAEPLVSELFRDVSVVGQEVNVELEFSQLLHAIVAELQKMVEGLQIEGVFAA